MNHKNTLVSIGIPFYNSEKYLEDTIKSVIKQSYSNWKLILIDDGSSDSSLNISQKFEKNDDRISIVSDGENLGLPKRLNQLSKLSKGYYYARMDADDIMHPDRIKNQVEYLENHPEIDLLGSGLISIDNENNITGIRKGRFLDNVTLQMAMKMTWCVHPTITGKLEWFQNNPYDEDLRRAQDYELWIRTVDKSKFVRLSEPYLFYREASTPSLEKYIQSTQYSLNTFRKNRKKLGMFNVIKLSINKLLKLAVYFVFSIFGLTDKLIERRSVKLEEKNKEFYSNILNRVIS
ncbi:MAG: glycosyltransferase family 2 protein [Flavobacteriaceae bacterium]|nr:glycosyltransferase family 2 protein [Flavobacteriaceae bacterium]